MFALRTAAKHLAARGLPVTRQASLACGTTVARFSSGAMDDLKTGTSAYMDLYPTKSTDGGKWRRMKRDFCKRTRSSSISQSNVCLGLRLGNIVPDFSAETTQGNWESFHEWKKGKWAILFSHP